MAEIAPPGIDTTTPNIARIYDYLLGGKDNFAADRETAKMLLSVIPDIAAIATDNRAFLARAIRFLAGEAGITQFLDLGGGLPTRLNVHELAPAAQVAYVDHDPVVVRHGEALLSSPGRVAIVQADLTDPGAVLDHPGVLRVLDLSRPVALICTATLHFVPDEADPYRVLATYRDRMAPGSYLTISHAPRRVPGEDPEHDEENATEVYSTASSQLHLRTLAEITRFFDGFELAEPGVVFMPDWRPDPGYAPAGRRRSLRAGVARKP